MCNSITINVMKKILLSFSALIAMLATTATFSACSSDDEQQSTATMIINASKGEYRSGTRTISLDGNKAIVTTWKTTDNVFVFKEGWTSQIGTLKPNADSNNNITKLTGDISSNGLNVGDNLEFIMPRNTWDYTGQDGTIGTISSNYDYGIARVQVTFFDQNNKVYGTTAEFKTQQAIVKYKLYYMDDANKKELNATSLTIVSEQGKLVRSRSLDGKDVVYGGLEVTPASPTNVFYVALRNDYDQPEKFTLTAKVVNNNATTIYTSASTSAHQYPFTSYKSHEVVMSLYDDTYTERDTYQGKVEETW